MSAEEKKGVGALLAVDDYVVVTEAMAKISPMGKLTMGDYIILFAKIVNGGHIDNLLLDINNGNIKL
jgi:hypothetical protein